MATTTPSTGSWIQVLDVTNQDGHLQDDQMDGYHLRTQMESMSMEDTDSCSEYGDSHTHHT